MNEEILNLIVKLIIAVISVLITGYVIPWIKLKINSTKYNDLLSLVKKCVEAAEKIYTPTEWSSKKKYVLEVVEQYASNHRIKITANEINAIIEGWVKEIKG